METSVKQKRRWLIEFALVSLIPVLVVGLFLGQSIHSHSKQRATDSARRQAQLVADVAVRRALGPDADLSRMTADQRSELSQAIDGVRQGGDVVRATVRDGSGEVVYSDDPGSPGGGSAAPSAAQEALNGNSVSMVADLSSDPAAADATLGRVLEVFVPVRLGGPASPITGSMELWIPYAQVARQVDTETSSIYILLGVGLLFLWGTLLAVVAGASKRLPRPAAPEEGEALVPGPTRPPERPQVPSPLEERENVGEG